MSYQNGPQGISLHAQIHELGSVDPDATIQAQSEIEAHSRIASHVYIGHRNSIGQAVTIRGTPDAETRLGEENELEGIIAIEKGCTIGDNNRIRKRVTIGAHTTIENNVYIGQGASIERGAYIGAGATIEDNVMINPRIHIGQGSAVRGGTRVHKHILPYSVISGNPLHAEHLNETAAKNARLTQTHKQNIRSFYRWLFEGEEDPQEKIKNMNGTPMTKTRRMIIDFILGLCEGSKIAPVRNKYGTNMPWQELDEGWLL